MSITLVEPVDAISALWHAHVDVFGGECTIAWLETISAQTSFETARFRAVHDFDLGNLRGTGTAGAQVIPGANEIEGGKVVTGPEVEAGFAAYTTLLDGARALVRYLGTATRPPLPNRFQPAWDAAVDGDVVMFVHGLKYPTHGGAYFTADEHLYLRGVLSSLDWIRAFPLPKFLATLQVPGLTGELFCQCCKVAEADVQVMQRSTCLTERARRELPNVHGVVSSLLFCIECAKRIGLQFAHVLDGEDGPLVPQ